MIRGLQITIRSEELKEKIGERIAQHEAEIARLEQRLTARAGDLSIDVRLEDDLKTVDDLRQDRDVLRGRVLQLTLLRDNLVEGETYALDRKDLRLAELIPGCPGNEAEADVRFVDRGPTGPIEGLKLTIKGEDVRKRLEERIEDHDRAAAHWRKEEQRTPDDETEERPLLPSRMCDYEAERHEWRAEVLEFIRDHVEPAEVYHLSPADLEFGELLPEKPGSLEQQEYEERTSIGFNLERLTKRLGEIVPDPFYRPPLPDDGDDE